MRGGHRSDIYDTKAAYAFPISPHNNNWLEVEEPLIKRIDAARSVGNLFPPFPFHHNRIRCNLG